MKFCKATGDLNNNIDVLDMDDLKDELIEAKSNEFYDDLKKGKTIVANGNHYTLDCFIRDTEIPTNLIESVVHGHSLGLELYMVEALNSWCWDLAKGVIK